MDKRTSAPLLRVRGLHKSYVRRNWRPGTRAEVSAVQGVDLDVGFGQTLAITGKSGSGKSTLARCIAGLESPSAGEIRFSGHPVQEGACRHIQLIFQDPGASLNPRFSVLHALSEPLIIRHENANRHDLARRLEQVGLSDTLLNQRTSELSGGQKARLALARALAALDERDDPAILILDESLSSLDLSVQAQMLNLLLDLQEQRSLSYLLITHDLALAEHMADEIVVMSQGKIVERTVHA